MSSPPRSPSPRSPVRITVPSSPSSPVNVSVSLRTAQLQRRHDLAQQEAHDLKQQRSTTTYVNVVNSDDDHDHDGDNGDDGNRSSRVEVRVSSPPVSTPLGSPIHPSSKPHHHQHQRDESEQIQRLIDMRRDDERRHLANMKELHVYYAEKLREAQYLLETEQQKVLKARELAMMRPTATTTTATTAAAAAMRALEQRLRGEEQLRRQVQGENGVLRHDLIGLRGDYDELIRLLREENDLLRAGADTARLRDADKLAASERLRDKCDVEIREAAHALQQQRDETERLRRAYTALQRGSAHWQHDVLTTVTPVVKVLCVDPTHVDDRVNAALECLHRLSTWQTNPTSSSSSPPSSPPPSSSRRRQRIHPHHDHPSRVQRYNSPTRSSLNKSVTTSAAVGGGGGGSGVASARKRATTAGSKKKKRPKSSATSSSTSTSLANSNRCYTRKQLYRQ